MELEHLARNAEYGIPMTVEMEKEAETMCDYGRGLARKYAEKGRAEGLEKGLEKGIQQERNSNILGMLREKDPHGDHRPHHESIGGADPGTGNMEWKLVTSKQGCGPAFFMKTAIAGRPEGRPLRRWNYRFIQPP